MEPDSTGKCFGEKMGRIQGITEDILQSISNSTRFRIDVIEKIIRMNDFLENIFKHPYLKKRVLLKGGTGLNLCYLDKPRLSVDIDLNYIGSVDMETMQSERPEIKRAVQIIIKDKGYQILRAPTVAHAGGKWRLGYKDIYSDSKNLELDINYVFRSPIGKPIERILKIFPDSREYKVNLVSKEEMFAGKIIAALDRSLARDVYDIYNIIDFTDYDKVLFKKAVIFLGVAMKKDFRTISPSEVLSISDNDFNNSLKPLLRDDNNISKDILLKKVEPFVSKLLVFSPEESKFVNAFLDRGIFSPELLFDKYPDLKTSLKHHPSLLWKQKNLIEHLQNNSK